MRLMLFVLYGTVRIFHCQDHIGNKDEILGGKKRRINILLVALK